MNDQEIELLERASFGQLVEEFWGSRIGGYLRERATELYNAAIQELKEADPTDIKRIMKLQNDVRVAEWFEKWLSDAVIDGAKALELLEGLTDGY